jgi:hypothetical protein
MPWNSTNWQRGIEILGVSSKKEGKISIIKKDATCSPADHESNSQNAGAFRAVEIQLSANTRGLGEMFARFILETGTRVNMTYNLQKR